MAESVIGFIVAEDEVLLRKNLVKKILATDPRLRCLGTASDGEDALALLNETVPQILVTDIRMPVMDGLELIEKSLQLSPALGIVIVSGFDDFPYAQRAMRLGVSDFLLKPVQTDDLALALRRLRDRVDAEANEIEQEFGLGEDHLLKNLSEYADAMETWLRAHLNEEVHLGELCERLKLKPSYAVKIYKKCKGVTPMRHMTILRIRQACHLLSNGQALQIKQIAHLVGFDDPLYFSRVFGHETGCTPSEWRAKNLFERAAQRPLDIKQES